MNIILMEDSSTTLDLTPYVHDPDDRRDALQWGITSTVEGADYHFCSAPPDGAPMMHADDDSLVIYLDTTSARVYVQARKNFNGSRLPIVITVRDPEGLAAFDTLMVTVTPVNDPPVLAQCDEITMAEDDTLLLPNTLLASFVNDPDDADSLLLWHCSASRIVTPVRTQDGIRIHLASDRFGADSITITVVDRAGSSDSMRVAVRVLPVNDPPVIARVPNLIVGGDSALTFSLAGYVSDVDDPVSGLRAEIAPMQPTASSSPEEQGKESRKNILSGSAHFAIDSLMNVQISFSGRYECMSLPVLVRVFDRQGGIGMDTLFLTVTSRDLPPVILAIADTCIVPGQPYSSYVRAGLANGEFGPLTFSVHGPAWLSIDSTGKMSGIPPRESVDTVLVIVADCRGAADSVLFRIVARGVAAADVPADYVMFQNYPNPFNPATTIRFGLPEPSRVSAEVFNILGQRVATIFSSDLQEGYHTVQWAPVNLASGAYIIVLEAHGLLSASRDARMIKKVSLVR
jgi:hypothetical protein